MQFIQIQDAGAKFLALIDDAEHGKPAIITRHGRPVAAVVPVKDAQQLYPADRPSFANLLLSFPGTEFDRDDTPLDVADL